MSNQTIQQWLKHAQQQLSTLTDAYLEESHLILCDALQQSTTYLIANSQELLENNLQAMAENNLQQRLADKPLAYILGHTHFYGLPFKVTTDVLIPRNATEALVEHVLNHFEKTPIKIIDLGTGSGAIACTLAHHRPNWQVLATDISEKALAVAKQNAALLNLNHIEFQQSHWFDDLTPQYFDVIISNPPYIDIDDTDIDSSVKQHEPHQALFADNQGLADIEQLLQQAKQFLKPKGLLIIEHGHQQQKTIVELAKQYAYTTIQGYNDLAGLNRYIVAQL